MADLAGRSGIARCDWFLRPVQRPGIGWERQRQVRRTGITDSPRSGPLIRGQGLRRLQAREASLTTWRRLLGRASQVHRGSAGVEDRDGPGKRDRVAASKSSDWLL